MNPQAFNQSSPNRQNALSVAAAGILAAATLVIWMQSKEAEQAAIQNLPERERTMLYNRTLQNLAAVCTKHQAKKLSRFCNHQAELILQFKECDQACRNQAHAFLRGAATRS